MALTAPREALCLVFSLMRPGGQEFPRCLIINGHMSCGSRFPRKRKRSFPILAVMPTLKLAGAPKKQAMIPSRGTGALSRRRSPAGRAGVHPCSTPYSAEKAIKRAVCNMIPVLRGMMAESPRRTPPEAGEAVAQIREIGAGRRPARLACLASSRQKRPLRDQDKRWRLLWALHFCRWGGWELFDLAIGEVRILQPRRCRSRHYRHQCLRRGLDRRSARADHRGTQFALGQCEASPKRQGLLDRCRFLNLCILKAAPLRELAEGATGTTGE